jgi:hypothetical protein
MKKLKIDIPVKRYLKKYLYALENKEYDTPVDTTEGGHIPVVISLLFTSKLDLPFDRDPIRDFEDTLPVLIDWRRVERGMMVINSERLRFFNDFIYKSFMDTLLTKVLIHKEYGETEAKIIRRTMDELDIIDDANFDAIKKALYRLRKTRNYPLFYDRNCPVP